MDWIVIYLFGCLYSYYGADQKHLGASTRDCLIAAFGWPMMVFVFLGESTVKKFAEDEWRKKAGKE